MDVLDRVGWRLTCLGSNSDVELTSVALKSGSLAALEHYSTKFASGGISSIWFNHLPLQTAILRTKQCLASPQRKWYTWWSGSDERSSLPLLKLWRNIHKHLWYLSEISWRILTCPVNDCSFTFASTETCQPVVIWSSVEITTPAPPE